MSNQTNATIDEIMSQAQEFASSWSIVGGRFDGGYGLEIATESKAMLRNMIAEALDSQARQIEALTAERDELRKRADAERATWSERDDMHTESSRIYSRRACAVRAGAGDAAPAKMLRDEVASRVLHQDAKPATPAPGEWVEWLGGECPLTGDVIGSVRMRDGWESGPCHLKPSLTWSHSGSNGDIVAYRILP